MISPSPSARDPVVDSRLLTARSGRIRRSSLDPVEFCLDRLLGLLQGHARRHFGWNRVQIGDRNGPAALVRLPTAPEMTGVDGDRKHGAIELRIQKFDTTLELDRSKWVASRPFREDQNGPP